MRGRGGNPRGGRKGPFRHPPRFVTKPVFDFHYCEGGFERASPTPDDTDFTQALLKRNGDLSPTAEEQTAILNLVTKITGLADNLIVAPASFSGCVLDEVRPVGSYKKGTMLRGNNTADVVIILKTLPTKEAVEQLGIKMHDDLKVMDGMAGVTLEQNERGFSLSCGDAVVRCLITTMTHNIRNLDRDLHLDIKVVQAHLAAIRHSQWFEENGRYSSVKILVRLLKDLTNRFEGLSPLKPWMIDLFAHHATMITRNNQPLPINVAFRRCLQLLSSGFFLPLSASINDPCENQMVKVHYQMTLEEQDLVCMTAQVLMRVLSHGGYKFILGLEGDSNLSQVKVFNGVRVSLPDRVYEKPVRMEDGATENHTGHDDEMENDENAGMETAEA